MTKFIDKNTGLPHASYDLWEQTFATHTYTVAATYQALLAAADFAELLDYNDDNNNWTNAANTLLNNRSTLFNKDLGSYRKSIFASNKNIYYDDTLDVSSIYGVVMFDYHKDDTDKILSTITNIETRLLDYSPSGGVPRYENDKYFASKPDSKGNPWIVTTLWMAQLFSRAKEPTKAKHYVDWATKQALPSGVLSEQINPETSDPVSVTPLVWSHAELINTILDISK